MQSRLLCFVSVGAVMALGGCVGSTGLDPDEEMTGQTDGESATSMGPESTTSGEEGGETGPDDDTGGETSAIFLPPDGGSIDFDCDIWGQDCPEGHKCMPWDNMGAGSWNATKCTPLDANPAQPGDECMVEGTGVSGVDNCALASMCWAVDPETNTGTCVSFCSGTEANPSCDDPSTTCSITNGGALILCLPDCDPLAQECSEGQGCYGVGSTFICAPNASPPDMGNYGDPCMYLNVCNPGLFCASAVGVPDCQGSEGCCSEFCDLGSPDGAAQCQGADQGQGCIPYFEEGQAAPGFEDVGVCFIPD